MQSARPAFPGPLRTVIGDTIIRMVTVRSAAAADIDALVDLMRDFYAESDFPLDAPWAAQSFADLLADPARGAIWLIDADGRPVGHVVLSVRYAMEFGGLMGYIDDLYVRPEYRRRGAATAGIQALVAECQRRGCRSLHVEVDPANAPAIGVYQRFGLAPGTDTRLQLKTILPAAH
jgi:ribosomal protein S18 acetylase RimI-like enzyme